MATKKEVSTTTSEVKVEKKAPKKIASKKVVEKVSEAEVVETKAVATKKAVKVEAPVRKATLNDFEIILEPLITEKSMAQSKDENKFTFIVKKTASKTAIRKAIEKIYNVHVTGISTVNQIAKKTTRGSKYKGMISGFKKAIVTLRNGETINLFAE